MARSGQTLILSASQPPSTLFDSAVLFPSVEFGRLTHSLPAKKAYDICQTTLTRSGTEEPKCWWKHQLPALTANVIWVTAADIQECTQGHG